MKIDKRNPLHWLYLAAFGFNVACAMVLRPFLHRRRSGRVLLYGHKLSGNLLAIFEHARAHPRPGLELAFLTMDPAYHRELRREGVPAVLAISPTSIRWMASADAVVSDHGLHAMQAMLGRTDMKFFDVWHGIPFKGFDADDFRVQHEYNEVWVTSPLLRSLYIERYGFRSDRVKATGNPRTDLLQGGREGRIAARRALGLPETGKLVLFAPTWKQDTEDRSIFPFGIDEAEFLTCLSQVVQRHRAVLGLRTHLNTNILSSEGFGGVVHLPFARYPDTERLLVATDILICDWSSIAFDFMVLRRPTVFLDVPAPFAKGFSLDASYRYGEIVRSLTELEAALDRYLDDPATYDRKHGRRMDALVRSVYGGNDDGRAVERCIERLQLALR